MKPIWILVGVVVLVIISMLALKSFPLGFRTNEAFKARRETEGFAAKRPGPTHDVSGAKMGTGSKAPKAGAGKTSKGKAVAAPKAKAKPAPKASSKKTSKFTDMNDVDELNENFEGMNRKPGGPIATFQNMDNANKLNENFKVESKPVVPLTSIPSGFENMNEKQGVNFKNSLKEGFESNYGETAGGAKDAYQAMGAFDGVVLPTGNNVSKWRYTAPNEELLGAPFAPGDDSLFIFKNNQCKPECCGSSFSCSGGCVCTTPGQRDMINGRGGNRSAPAED